MDPESVIVIGAGIIGLGTARLLARAGIRVTVLPTDSSPSTSDRPTPFDRLQVDEIDPVDPDDTDLAASLRELGLSERLFRRNAGSAFIGTEVGRASRCVRGSCLVPLLPIVYRLRSAELAKRIRQRNVPSQGALDERTAHDWLCDEVGEQAVGRFWRPLLRAHFGDGWTRVSALVVHRKIERCALARHRDFGGFEGGLQTVFESLRSESERLGVQFEPKCPVESVALAGPEVVVRTTYRSHRAARTVLTTPAIESRRLLSTGGVETCLDSLATSETETFAVWLEIDRPLFGRYWTAVEDPRLAFQAVLEITAVRSPVEFGGRHVVCLLDRSGRGSFGGCRAESILAVCRESLALLQPDRPMPVISKWRLAQRREPFFEVRSFDSRPPLELVFGRVYLANEHHAYPNLPSLSGRLRVAQRVAEYLIAHKQVAARLARSTSVATPEQA